MVFVCVGLGVGGGGGEGGIICRGGLKVCWRGELWNVAFSNINT